MFPGVVEIDDRNDAERLKLPVFCLLDTNCFSEPKGVIFDEAEGCLVETRDIGFTGTVRGIFLLLVDVVAVVLPREEINLSNMNNSSE